MTACAQLAPLYLVVTDLVVIPIGLTLSPGEVDARLSRPARADPVEVQGVHAS